MQTCDSGREKPKHDLASPKHILLKSEDEASSTKFMTA
jgi:hypothetical protein